MKPRKKILSTCAALMSAAAAAIAAAPTPTVQPGNLPLDFEANHGQAASAVKFLARGPGCQLFVSPAEAVLQLTRVDSTVGSTPLLRATSAQPAAFQTRAVRLSFLDANPTAQVSGLGQLPGSVNYFIGNDPAGWHAGVPTFSSVRVEEIYPGISLVYYGNPRRLEYDFIVAPHADPSAIAIRFEGADNLRINERGDLVVSLGADEIVQPKPVIYQTVRGARQEISGGYRLTQDGTLTFQTGAYDSTLPLVIDPVLSYSTFFGGTGADTGWAVALDTAGNVYMAGESLSANLPTGTSLYTNQFAGGTYLHGDAFVAKFDNRGSNVIYRTYIGGTLEEAAFALAVDGAGNAHIAGYTDSINFPCVNALATNISGVPSGTGFYPLDAFVTKLGPLGTNLIFSTYLGGTSTDLALGIALDGGTNIFVAGYTLSTNFPVSSALQTNQAGNGDAFVVKINPTGTSLIYSTYLGGTNQDVANDIVTDAAGYAIVTGYTGSTNFPIVNALQSLLNNTTNFNASFDVFATRLTPAGNAITASTFLGGLNNDFGFRGALDSQGNFYVTGSTRSADFPGITTNLPSTVINSAIAQDVFVVKLSPQITNRIYTAVFGGTYSDEGWDIAVDAAGHAHVTGATTSPDFPVVNTSGLLSAFNTGLSDAFVAELDTNGTTLVHSAFLGGSGSDFGYGIEVDPAGNSYITGETGSTDFPSVSARQPTFGGGLRDAFLAKITPRPALTIAAAGPNVELSWSAFAPEYLLVTRTNLFITNGWSPVTVAPVIINGRHTVTLPATNSPAFFNLYGP